MINNIDSQISAIAGLDLIVTATMSVCDFAGSVGTPCWTLVPSKPLWRFGGKDNSRPWYRTEKLYRQINGESDWTPAINRLISDLKVWRHDWRRQAA